MRLHVDACGMGVRSIEPEIRSGMPTYMSRYPAPISEDIWKQKYRFGAEAGIEDTWQRVARAVASVELRDADVWQIASCRVDASWPMPERTEWRPC